MKIVSTSLLVFFLFINLSCKKNPEYVPTADEIAFNKDISVATTLMSIEILTNEMEFIARQVPLNAPGTSFLNCASIASQDTIGGKKYEVTFNSLSTCNDNKVRSGKLTIIYQTTSGTILITPNNYMVSNLKVQGSYFFQPITEEQKALLKLVVTGGQMTAGSGDFVKFNVERKSNFKEGSTTTTSFADDVFETVSAIYHLELKSETATNVQIEASSTSPYLLKYSCSDKFRPRSGKINFEREVGTDRYVFMGNGNCGDNPTLSKTP